MIAVEADFSHDPVFEIDESKFGKKIYITGDIVSRVFVFSEWWIDLQEESLCNKRRREMRQLLGL
jgi:hypothetical protein